MAECNSGDEFCFDELNPDVGGDGDSDPDDDPMSQILSSDPGGSQIGSGFGGGSAISDQNTIDELLYGDQNMIEFSYSAACAQSEFGPGGGSAQLVVDDEIRWAYEDPFPFEDQPMTTAALAIEDQPITTAVQANSKSNSKAKAKYTAKSKVTPTAAPTPQSKIVVPMMVPFVAPAGTDATVYLASPSCSDPGKFAVTYGHGPPPVVMTTDTKSGTKKPKWAKKGDCYEVTSADGKGSYFVPRLATPEERARKIKKLRVKEQKAQSKLVLARVVAGAPLKNPAKSAAARGRLRGEGGCFAKQPSRFSALP